MKTFHISRFLLALTCLITALTVQAQETDTLRRETPVMTAPDTVMSRRDLSSEDRYPEDRFFNRPGLPWFRRNAAFIGAGFGFATGKGQGLYTAFTPRLAFFVQRGLAVGIRGRLSAGQKPVTGPIRGAPLCGITRFAEIFSYSVKAVSTSGNLIPAMSALMIGAVSAA